MRTRLVIAKSTNDGQGWRAMRKPSSFSVVSECSRITGFNSVPVGGKVIGIRFKDWFSQVDSVKAVFLGSTTGVTRP